MSGRSVVCRGPPASTAAPPGAPDDMPNWPRRCRDGRYRDGCWIPYLKEPVLFLLITMVGVFLGIAYAGFVDRRLGPKDWRRWMALTPFWALAAGVALALHTVNFRDLAPQAIVTFAFASLGETLIDSLRALRRRRADASARRDDRVTRFTDAST